MATRVQKEKPFTVETMKGFNSIAEAVKYFSQVKQPVRQRRVVNLFNEAYELNIGAVSLNMAIFRNDNKKLDAFIKIAGIFNSEKSVERLKKAVGLWIGKTPDVKNPIEDVKQPIDEVKTTLINETPTE
jgi:hypothetical protein